LFVCIGLVVFLLEQYETFVEPLVFSLVAGFVLANFTSKRKEFMHVSGIRRWLEAQLQC